MPAHSSAAQAKTHAHIGHSPFPSCLSINVPGHTAPGAGHEIIHLLKEARETQLLPECSKHPQRHHTVDPQIFPGPSMMPWDALARSASSLTRAGRGRSSRKGRTPPATALSCPAFPPKPYPFPLRPSRVPARTEVRPSASTARPASWRPRPPPHSPVEIE